MDWFDILRLYLALHGIGALGATVAACEILGPPPPQYIPAVSVGMVFGWPILLIGAFFVWWRQKKRTTDF